MYTRADAFIYSITKKHIDVGADAPVCPNTTNIYKTNK